MSNNIPINIIPNILNEEDIDVVIDEIVNDKDFEKSDTEIETHESIEQLKYPQEYHNGGIITLVDLNEKEMLDPRVQTMFKRSRHIELSIFIFSQDYYELKRERFVLMEISTTYSNQTIIVMSKISIKTKRPWI